MTVTDDGHDDDDNDEDADSVKLRLCSFDYKTVIMMDFLGI
jgi:hypothetical protein